MDRFVAHCVATAAITAALAAVSTVRAEPSGAAEARHGARHSAAARAAARTGATQPGTTQAGMTRAATTQNATTQSATTQSATTQTAAVAPPPTSIAAPVSGAATTTLMSATQAAAVPGVSIPAATTPAVSMPVASPLTSEDTTSLPAAAAGSGVSKGAVCADAYQVGPTTYAYWHGEIIFSVKQFYSPSCHARYSYGFAWLQFRDQNVPYEVGLAVYDTKRDELDGGAQFEDGIGSPNYWSAPVTVSAGSCTEANVHLFLPDDETDTYTQKVCF
jgi:hypothetical protein